MFICMCTKRKTGCLFFPPFARDSYLETPCRQVVEQRDIDLGVHDREVGSGSCFSLGEGNQNMALESKDGIPRKLTNGIRRKCSFSISKRNKVGAGFSRILNSSPAISGCSYDWQDFASKLIASNVYQPFSPFFGIHCIFAWRLSFLIFHHLFP